MAGYRSERNEAVSPYLGSCHSDLVLDVGLKRDEEK